MSIPIAETDLRRCLRDLVAAIDEVEEQAGDKDYRDVEVEVEVEGEESRIDCTNDDAIQECKDLTVSHEAMAGKLGFCRTCGQPWPCDASQVYEALGDIERTHAVRSVSYSGTETATVDWPRQAMLNLVSVVRDLLRAAHLEQEFRAQGGEL